MNDTIILHQTSLQDFKILISDILEDKLKKYQTERTPTKSDQVYLTRKEVCKRLKISLTTLHNYGKLRILNPLQIGGKILFRAEEIEKAVSEIQSGKYKHGRGQ